MLPVKKMIRRTLFVMLASVSLSGCSYAYDIIAVVQNGRLTFIVDPESKYRQPSCLRQIEVTAQSGPHPAPAAGDDALRVGYGTYWSASVGYDDACANRFPIPYGSPLEGKIRADQGKVAPKPLLREVEYEVSTTTGATGYGGGRFIIHANGRVENLPHAELIDDSDVNTRNEN